MEDSTKKKVGAGSLVAGIAAVTGLYTAVHGSHSETKAITEDRTPIVVNRPRDASGSPLPVTVQKLPNGQPLVIVGHGAPVPCPTVTPTPSPVPSPSPTEDCIP